MKIKDIVLNWLYPSRCAFCHKLSDDGVLLCKWCEKSLPYTSGLAVEQSFPHVARCVSPLYYVDDVRNSVLRYKFSGATGYSKVYGELLAKCIDENKIFCDIITWVPLSRIRQHFRGYNQSELIAREISKAKNIPCAPLLKKVKHNKAQSGVGRYEKRRANVAGVYSSINHEMLNGKRVLLIDDVVTTGATMSECAKELKKGGAKLVCAASIARRKE